MKTLSPLARLAARAFPNLARMTCPTLKVLLSFGLFHAGIGFSQNVWTGGAGTTNWSTPGNWSFGLAPTAGDTVQFDNVLLASPAAVVDNLVDTDFTISGLTYSTVATNGFHTTLLPGGLSLNINGSGADAIFVGTGLAQGSGHNTYSRFVGPGTVTVTNTAGAIRVMQWGDNTDHRATLDFSGLTNLDVDVRQVLVATTVTTGEQDMMATLLLAETNFVHTAAGVSRPGILVGSMDNGSTGKRATQQIFLGQNNTIYSDAITVGGFKMDASLQVRSGISAGLTALRGSAGGSDPVKILSVGDHRAGPVDYLRNGTSAAVIGTFDTSGNFLDALVQDLFVARAQTNNSGLTTGTLTFNQGTLTADNMNVGYHQSPSANNAAFNAVGTVNVNGTATLTVNNDLLLARKVGTNTPTATLNLSSSGTLNVKGNIVNGGGNSTINFNNGGTINMQPSGDATAGDITVSTLTGSGSIINAGNVTNSTTLAPGGTATAGTLAIVGSFMLPSTTSVNFTLADVNTVGGGINDLVSVTGNLTFNNNTLNLVPTGTTLAAASYRLFDYTGTLAGTLNFVNPTRYSLSVDYGTPNQVNLVNTGGSPGSVTWTGSTNGNWNVTATNWNGNSDRFFNLDAVTFDNAGVGTNVSLAGTLYPVTVTVDSSTNYFFTGSGRISGAASITKSGTGTLLMANTGANDYTGPVTINGGTLKAGRTDSLGSTNSGTTVSGGGTLDLGGISLFNPGEFVTISGNGVGNAGAIINSGADQNNGLRYVSLAGDATIGSSSPGRWDIRGPGGASSFSGGLFLNGFTLTKVGVGKNSLVDSVITNAGSIVLSNGTLGITRTIMDGPGTISAFGTNILQLENSSTGYVTKPLIFSGGGSTFQVTGNAFTLFSPITNVGGLTIDNAVGFTVTNGLSGAGYLTKISAGNLTLLAPDTHSGPTTISAGRLTLGADSSMASTPSISLGSGVVFDASAIPGGFVLGTGQTLSGSGLVLGDVTAGAGRVLIPGLSAGTLTFTNSLTLDSTTNIIELGSDPTMVGGGANDLISVGGNLTLTGMNTLKIVPLGPLSDAIPYTVMMYTNTLTGGLANLQAVSDNPRYTFTVVDPATTPNAIQVSVIGVPTTLLWNGGQPGNPTVWNGTVSNWLNGIASDTFFSGDNVKFDDTATTNLVTLAGTLLPASMIVSNESRAYTFGAAGGLTGGSLTKQGAAGLSFTNFGAVSYSAGVTLDAGVVTFANGSANNFGGPFVINAGPVTFANNGLDTFAGGLVVNAGVVQVANPGANTYGTGIRLEGGTLTLNQPLDVTVSSTISNSVSLTAGSLVKQGANALTLSGNNANFDGSILVSAGMLRAGNANALGNINGGTTVADGATLDINGQSLFNPGDLITIAGAGLTSTGAVINTGAAQNNAVRALTLSANASVAAWGNRWDVRGPGGSGSFSGAVNLGGFTLTKLGAGRISVVDAQMTDPGSVEVVAGMLAFTRSSVDGAGFINIGANLLLFENNSIAITFTKPLIFNGGTLQVTGNALGITSPITNLASLTVDAAVAFTAQGPITGPGGLAKIGASSLILAETNDYAGGTLISAGTVQLGLNGTLGNLPPQPSGVLTNNGTLIFNRSDDVTMSDQITGSGGVQQLAGGTVFLTASNSYSGQTLLNTTIANSPGGAALRISHSWALGDTVGNTRIVGNSAANTRLELVGDITVPEPFLVDARQGTDAHIPAILNVSGTNTLTGNITGNTGGTEYNIQSDGGKLIVAGNYVPPSTAGTRRLKLMGDGNGEWSGVISNSADTLVVALLTKTNLGTWTLSGSNVYRGNTTIAEGTLALAATGSIDSTPAIDVQSNATFNVAAVTGGYVLGADQTLIGSGTVIGNVTANGTISPGASIGTLTFADNLVLAGTNIMEIDRDATPANADLIVANGLTYGGTLVVNNIGLPLQSGDTFNLFDRTTGGGSFAATILPALDPSLAWDLSNLPVNGTIRVGPSVSTTPTNLTFQVTGNSLDISWPFDQTGWRLESQTNPISVGITTNWFAIAGSSATNRVILDIDRSNGTVFFRLAYP